MMFQLLFGSLHQVIHKSCVLPDEDCQRVVKMSSCVVPNEDCQRVVDTLYIKILFTGESLKQLQR